jgi:hypothetical protein
MSGRLLPGDGDVELEKGMRDGCFLAKPSRVSVSVEMESGWIAAADGML